MLLWALINLLRPICLQFVNVCMITLEDNIYICMFSAQFPRPVLTGLMKIYLLSPKAFAITNGHVCAIVAHAFICNKTNAQQLYWRHEISYNYWSCVWVLCSFILENLVGVFVIFHQLPSIKGSYHQSMTVTNNRLHDTTVTTSKFCSFHQHCDFLT